MVGRGGWQRLFDNKSFSKGIKNKQYTFSKSSAKGLHGNSEEGRQKKLLDII